MTASSEIYNYIKINDQLVTAGQPTAEQLRAAAGEGFTTVINLAPFEPRFSLLDEEKLVRELGMSYHNIPVVWGDPQESDFAVFERTMETLPPGKTLIHCIANYRVTAFYSLYALKHLGWTETQAAALRAQIWDGSNYPVWESFIARMMARIR